MVMGNGGLAGPSYIDKNKGEREWKNDNCECDQEKELALSGKGEH